MLLQSAWSHSLHSLYEYRCSLKMTAEVDCPPPPSAIFLATILCIIIAFYAIASHYYIPFDLQPLDVKVATCKFWWRTCIRFDVRWTNYRSEFMAIEFCSIAEYHDFCTALASTDPISWNFFGTPFELASTNEKNDICKLARQVCTNHEKYRKNCALNETSSVGSGQCALVKDNKLYMIKYPNRLP